MTTMIAAVLAVAALAADPATVTGTWNMGLQADHVIPVALVLEQDGKTVTGTIALPTQRHFERIEVKLSGEFADGALKLSGTVEGAKEPTTLEITGRMQDDGTLEGRLAMPQHDVPFTAARLKERK